MLSVHLIYGSDPFKITKAAKELVERLVPESERDLALEVIDGGVDTIDAAIAVIRQATEALQTQSMFGGAKTVWVRNVTFLASRRLEKSDDLDKMIGYLRKVMAEGIPEGHALVLSGDGIPGNSGIVNTVKKLVAEKRATLTLFEEPKAWASNQEAEAFILGIAAERGAPLPDETATALVARAGTDSGILVSELEKLNTYAGGRPPTPEDVLTVVTLARAAEAWDVQDAFGLRNLPGALSVYRRLVDMGTSPIMLVIQLENRVNDLLLLRDSADYRLGGAVGRGGFQWANLPEELHGCAADLGKKWDPAQKHPFVMSKLATQAAKFKRIELRRARKIFMDAHERMVSSGVDAEAILELALIEAMS